MAGIINGSTAPRADWPISLRVACRTLAVGLRTDMTYTSIIRIAARTAAGRSPAMNIAPIETGTTDPRTSMAMLGGIVSDIAAEADSTAAPSLRR
jgi:hypothetical protein